VPVGPVDVSSLGAVRSLLHVHYVAFLVGVTNVGCCRICLRMITTALFIVRLPVQVYSGERVVEGCTLVTQAEVYWFHKPSQAKPKVLTGDGDLREAQNDVRLSVSHSCV
jgi:hypothetical protein